MANRIPMHKPPAYVTSHKPKANWKPEKERGGSSARGYGAPWRRLRERVLERDKGLCAVCLALGRVVPATEVDHILAKAAGGTDAMENLQAICKPHHKKKTAREQIVAKKAREAPRFNAL